MLSEILSLVILSAITGHCIGWVFPQIQWIKQKLGISMLDLDELVEIHYSGKSTKTQSLKHLFAKATNCSSCMAFWSCMALMLLFCPWWWCIFTPLAYSLAAIIPIQNQ